ncbi:MAG: alpha/beta hydrolase [Gammaproteobacteria bacterium]|nr:alpha/beta hydrolase [Gammaproteobacteria bacterium]
MTDSFSGFKHFKSGRPGRHINGVIGGKGPPLLLLHGYPQTHMMWHKVTPDLARQHTVIAADLIGYGDSDKPPSDASHTAFSKRAMADDLIHLMSHLGFQQFAVVGHDRGGRVAHRMAVDHPTAVKALAVLDIAPTREMYANVSDDFARAYWHWYFLIQPAPFPERMISADSDAYMMHKLGLGTSSMEIFTPEALQSYLTAFRNPETVRASTEDYRAAATIDLEHDEFDIQQGNRVQCPLLALWGLNGVIERCFDALTLWRQRATNVQGDAIPGGHYLAEEHPDLVNEKLLPFLEKFGA